MPHYCIMAELDLKYWSQNPICVCMHRTLEEWGKIAAYTCTIKQLCFFKKLAYPGLFYRLFSVFSSKHHYNNFYNKI